MSLCINGAEHDKCWSNIVLTSYPPQSPWICRRCGKLGVDVGECVDATEYDKWVSEWDKRHA